MQFEYSGLWLLPIIALSVAISYYFYQKDKSIASAPRRIRILLTALRSLILIAAAAMLIGPFIQIDRSQLLKPIIIMLQDDSRSIGAVSSDSAYLHTEYLQKRAELKARIGEQYEVRSYSFGADAKETDTVTFGQAETDYDAVFENMQQLYSDENIGAVIIATDGNHTRGQALAYSARKLQTAAPFYAVALGDTVKRADLYLADLRYNEKGYVNKITQIAINVGWQGIAEQGTVLRLYAGDSLVSEKKLPLKSRQGTLSELFSFVPMRPGNYKMRASAERPKSDVVPANNDIEFYLSVYESRKKIVFVNSFVSPDAGAFYRALSSNSSYEVLQMRQLADNALDKCALVVLSGADAQQTVRTAAEKRNIPLLWLRGMDNILRGDYVKGVTIAGTSPTPDEAALSPNEGFKLFDIDKSVAALSRRSMPIYVPYGKYSMNDVRMQTAAFQQIKGIDTDRPLITVYRKDTYKLVQLLGSGYWNWRMQCYRDNGNFEVFDHFANTLSEYLLANAGMERFTVNSPKSASENDEIRITAQVLDAAMQLTNTADVSLVIKDSAGAASQYQFVSIGTEYHLSLGRLHPGVYTFDASAQMNSEHFTQSGIIRIAESNAELVSTAADIGALKMLTEEHSGGLFFPHAMAAIADSIEANPALPVYTSSTEYVELIDIPWLLALFAALLFAEWALRKLYGGF